jgi:hypothetical protein
VETGLYYNRFRYYNPETGLYISQDPIGLAGNNPNFYAYTFDSNTMVDVFGLWTIKLGGYKIQVHANDVDPWPSNPHGHIYDKGLVIDNQGKIFKSHNGPQVDKLSKKDAKIWKEALASKCK